MNHTPYAIRHTLTIGWLYPDLMNTYGDRGNIIVLRKRCEWRGIGVEIINLDVGFSHKLLATCDLLFMGGAQDKQQQIVAKDFSKEKIKSLSDAIGNGIPGLYICGAYQFLGKYYKEAGGEKIPGLGILDLYTENPGEEHERLIGNIIIEADSIWRIANSKKTIPHTPYPIPQIVGFENHGGRTYLGQDLKPFGKVISGFGNNGIDKTEGAVYKNSFGTYLHGPILPKNPDFADYLIKLALEKKYTSCTFSFQDIDSQNIRRGVEKVQDKETINLSPLDDSLETSAHNFIIEKIKS